MREGWASSSCQTYYLLLINTELSGICYPSGNTIKSGSKCFLLIALFMSRGSREIMWCLSSFSMHTESAISGRTLLFLPIFSSIRLKFHLSFFGVVFCMTSEVKVPAVTFTMFFDRIVSSILTLIKYFGKKKLGQCFQGNLWMKSAEW